MGPPGVVTLLYVVGSKRGRGRGSVRRLSSFWEKIGVFELLGGSLPLNRGQKRETVTFRVLRAHLLIKHGFGSNYTCLGQPFWVKYCSL